MIRCLRAYLYGFLCHFILDSECHPYISCYMEEHGLGHLEIETDFERYLLEKSGHDPLCYVPTHHLISRRHTREQISRMFENVTAYADRRLYQDVPQGLSRFLSARLR